MAARKKKPTIQDLIQTIGKLKSDHQRYIFKLNKKNEILETELKTEREQNIEKEKDNKILREEIQALKLKLNKFESESERNISMEIKNQCVEKSEIEYEVEEIISDKIIKRKKHYLVHWKGFDKEHDSWVPKKNLNCSEILEKYEKYKLERK